MKIGTKVLVTTEFRGVFFGQLANVDKLPDEVTLKGCRNCIYWDSKCKGFLGLAATGPTAGCRIGPEVAECTLWKVTSVTPVTEEAAEAWEKAPWS